MKRKSTITHTSNIYNDVEHEDQQDRLSSLPDVLLIYIFSFIDTKLALQSQILSKRWVNLWTLLPVLNFDYSFLQRFDHFIHKVLTYRNASIKLDALNIKLTDYNTMATVFNYALVNRVSNLSIDTSDYLTKYRPIQCLNGTDSLRKLELKGMFEFGRFSVCSGLVKLRLERVKIVESDPFSCFPNLKELCLVNCKVGFDLAVLEVIGFELLRLTISSCFYHPVPYEKLVLLTPKLKVLEISGLIPMSFEACELPGLDTVHIDCCFSFVRSFDRIVQQPDEEEQKVNLIKMFWCIRNAKCIHLSPSTVKLLSLSHEKLVEEPCPFVNLKVLNLIPPPNKPVGELHSSVATYLLKGSPRAVVKSLPR
ncbi:putative leucine-rich repeat domain superfamily, F-box-like domain superfamily [Helianthus annuus]|uniref:Leucine-rich repeat domain superfamily, F-box-like domain superfamily n=1 Tax=Helianthus annuus TaxID=4232 RepID=A0A251UBR5_HELAN|nr:F-box/FBD/LRR-repeat protein At5g56420 [Helianthus annuus]KAF5799080.1 putative leucine-rich repeat domain superfamily, F-box-like domain superfamily [Helianthus annuus]KAJ0563532.1 putative leucine-rich repeat domain superfamily, F-box-like domain superfamily [Helianthus annuus]KAJ0908453.1 putative leucine-rich repeat domain superfamily, F-box-like domain superfamily [Helianthus annuus]